MGMMDMGRRKGQPDSHGMGAKGPRGGMEAEYDTPSLCSFLSLAMKAKPARLEPRMIMIG